MERKTALVTGGGRGIGLETARLFVEQGIRTLIVDCNLDNLRAAKAELNSDLVEIYCVDITKEDNVNTNSNIMPMNDTSNVV